MIYILVHYPERELMAKTLLASYFVSNGFNVVIGKATELRQAFKANIIKLMQNDIVFEIATNPESIPRLNFYKTNQVTCFSFCEEGTAFPNAYLYSTNRLIPEAFNLIKGFFLGVHGTKMQSISLA